MLANLLIGDVASPDEADVLVPDVNWPYSSDQAFQRPHGRRRGFFRVHAPYDPALRRVVYVVRDPRDTLISYFYYHKHRDPEFSLSLGEFLDEPLWPCDWGAHVSGWLDNHHAALLFLTYEGMQSNPTEALRRVSAFCGLAPRDDEIVRAVEGASFRRLREIEDRGRLATGVPPDRVHFFRRGVVGGWAEEPDGRLASTIERRYGPLMQKLGYTVSTESRYVFGGEQAPKRQK